MRRCSAGVAAVVAMVAISCRRHEAPDEPASPPSPDASSGLGDWQPPQPKLVASETIAFERRVQASKLELQPARVRNARLAFGDGVLGQLAADELRVFDLRDHSLVASYPLEGPRALVRLSGGALLAAGRNTLVRYDPASKKLQRLTRPVLLPGAELRPDAVSPDRIWVFDTRRGAGTHQPSASLSGMLLADAGDHVLLPDREVELPPGILGTTREGVWLSFGAGQAQRFAPGGARLGSVRIPDLAGLVWALPTRRLDQVSLIHADGRLARAVVSPLFKRLDTRALGAAPYWADSGDEGRVLAIVVVAGDGPRFELRLFDSSLQPLGQAELPTDPPTGREDWVQVVTANQQVVVARDAPLVAVGGPARVLVFDGAGRQIFTIPSR